MNKPIQITIPHQLGAEEARRRVASGFRRVAEQMPGVAMAQFTDSWAGDRMSFAVKTMGQTMSGHVDVADKEVRMEVQLPAILAMLGEKLRGRLAKAGQLLLAKK